MKLILVLFAILLCRSDATSQYITEKDEFAGVTRIKQIPITVWGTDSLHGKPFLSVVSDQYSSIRRIQGSLIVVNSNSSTVNMALRFVYTGRGWMFLEPLLRAKLDTIETIEGLEPDRDVLYGDIVRETITFPISKEQLREFTVRSYKFRLTTREGDAVDLDVSRLRGTWQEMYKSFVL